MQTLRNLIVSLLFITFLGVASYIPVQAVQDPVFRITSGSSADASTIFQNIPEVSELSGYRTYCRVSHISYNNPISYRNQPGSSHLHTFVGNTKTNAYTTSNSLSNSDNSTCTGGIGGAYWVPTLMDQSNQPVIPTFVALEFKSHEAIDQLQPIPDGLVLTAAKNNQGCLERSTGDFDCVRIQESGGKVAMYLFFPNCLQVRNGQPVLSSSNNSHSVTRYYRCPDSHPYRIPMISTTYTYDIPFNSSWRVSTDSLKNGQTLSKGSTLRGSLITQLSQSHKNDIDTCLKREQNCQLYTDSPAENTSPEGTLLYSRLQYISDPTPLGSLSPFQKAEPAPAPSETPNTSTVADKEVDEPNVKPEPQTASEEVTKLAQAGDVQINLQNDANTADIPTDIIEDLAANQIIQQNPQVLELIEEGLTVEEIEQKLEEDGVENIDMILELLKSILIEALRATEYKFIVRY